MTNLEKARWIAFLVPAGLLGGAYVSQYGFNLFPCEMCWWQRYPHFVAIALGLLAFALKSARWPVALAALAVLASGLIGAFHAGVEYGWWEGFTRCTSMVEKGSDPLAAVLAAPITRCDEVQWSLFGISLAGFNFLISTAGALVALALLRKRA
ncbi:MAG: disulfide bond formation protein B [Novosphingobium sp.]